MSETPTSDTPVYDQMRRELFGFPAPHTAAKGDVYEWLGVRVTVLRVASDSAWADVSCELDGHTWTKRQPLPLPEEAELVATRETSQEDSAPAEKSTVDEADEGGEGSQR